MMPVCHDQPDNSKRLERLGVGRTFSVRQCTGATIARLLGELLDDPRVAERCQELARGVERRAPFDRACQEIEALAPLAPVPALK
jgi:UDP:flavonoid glycosyltransferase YjiC (YdhE family)